MSTIGKTKDAGWQIGAQKTFGVDHKTAWDFMFSPDGVKVWLGDCDFDGLEVGKSISNGDGITAEITVFKPYSHVRMKWKKKEWANVSRLQVRVMNSNGKAVIAFHQEMLDGAAQREEMKAHWHAVLNQLGREVAAL